MTIYGVLQIKVVIYLFSGAGLFVEITQSVTAAKWSFAGAGGPCPSRLPVHPSKPPCLLCSAAAPELLQRFLCTCSPELCSFSPVFQLHAGQ